MRRSEEGGKGTAMRCGARWEDARNTCNGRSAREQDLTNSD